MGKKIPEGWSCLCYCFSSWEHRKWWWWRTPALGIYVNTVTQPAGSGLAWTAPAHSADAHEPMNGCLHICSLQKLDGPPSTVQDGLVIYCTVLDSTAPVKNQPPWKAAKKFQQCESRNKLGTSITIAAIARISPTIFPPHVWIVLHSCHEAQKSSLPTLSLASRMHPLLVPSMCSDTRGITIAVSPKCFLQIMTIAKTLLLHEFYSPYSLFLTQAPVSNCSFVGCNCNQYPAEINEL